ncbi:hypothetical protein [Neobacillus niacini]|uniref:hypothetical protein n=1 Tax=Neobacillus niacini TaxID=86668 RepID=UPI002856328E|nr:hypothetical protein [Neobacillus niacini]MDR7001127.1 putative nucleic acid-binding Zn-ribbon protein [Neobacillus niacini]
MKQTLEKLQELHRSVQKLETVLQEVWTNVDELGEDDGFKDLKKNAKQSKNGLLDRMNEFNQFLGEIPEDGTAAVDLEDAISELMDWVKANT